jgi:hypothetical protein
MPASPAAASTLLAALRHTRHRGGIQLPAAGSRRGSSCVRDLLPKVGSWRVMVWRLNMVASVVTNI